MIDLTAIENLRLMFGDQAGIIIPSLISEFLADIPTLIADAEIALVQQQRTDLRRVAHTIYSLANNFGATELAAIAGELEELVAKGKPLDKADALITQAKDAYTQTKAILEKI